MFKIISLSTIILLIFSGLFLYSARLSKDSIINIGTPVWVGYKFLYFAKDRGIFSESTRLLELNSASEVIRAYRNGLLSGMCLTSDEIVRNFTPERPFVIVMVIDSSEGADVIIAQKDIKNPKMVKNKKIGLEKTALGYYMVKKFLEKIKLDENEIELVYLEPHEHYKAFIENKVDAIVTYEPIATKILNITEGKIIFSSREIPGDIYDFLVFDREFLLKNKKAVKKLLISYFKTMKNYDKEQIFAYSMKKYRVSKDKLENILNGIQFFNKEESLKLLMDENLELKLRNIEKYLNIKPFINYNMLIDKKLIRELYDFNS